MTQLWKYISIISIVTYYNVLKIIQEKVEPGCVRGYKEKRKPTDISNPTYYPALFFYSI